jgi:hypothetical protein
MDALPAEFEFFDLKKIRAKDENIGRFFRLSHWPETLEQSHFVSVPSLKGLRRYIGR